MELRTHLPLKTPKFPCSLSHSEPGFEQWRSFLGTFSSSPASSALLFALAERIRFSASRMRRLRCVFPPIQRSRLRFLLTCTMGRLPGLTGGQNRTVIHPGFSRRCSIVKFLVISSSLGPQFIHSMLRFGFGSGFGFHP